MRECCDRGGDTHPVGVAELPAMIAACEQADDVVVEVNFDADCEMAPAESTISAHAIEVLGSETLDAGAEANNSDDEDDDEASASPASATAPAATAPAAAAASAAADGDSQSVSQRTRSSPKWERRDRRGATPLQTASERNARAHYRSVALEVEEETPDAIAACYGDSEYSHRGISSNSKLALQRSIARPNPAGSGFPLPTETRPRRCLKTRDDAEHLGQLLWT